MNYKDVIKSREMRTRILHFLDWVPDRIMIPIQYRIKTGHTLDLRDPKRFTEKLQWMKLHYRDPLMARCVDKYDVRSYVEEQGLGDTLVPLLGVYSSADEVDFATLPERFVLKDTLGGGGNDVIVCDDRASFDEAAAREAMRRWAAPGRHRKSPGREWVYDREGSSRIVCEVYLEPEDPEHGLTDYKFLCFSGEPFCCYVMTDRVPGKSVRLGIFDVPGFRNLGVWNPADEHLEGTVDRPVHYEEMIRVARTLAAPFPCVRVDLYDEGDVGVRFGELTFFPASGYQGFDPDEFDYLLGKPFVLPEPTPA